MNEKLISRKKPTYPINERLYNYLTRYNRNIKIPIFYDDLLRFSGSVTVYDKYDNDTLWIRVYYPEFEQKEIDLSLKRMYNILHGDGTDAVLEYLIVDEIDYCTFGNSKPFRVKIRNILNDNYAYIYVKKADASRVYGLEFEDILSPNRIHFLIHKDTLVEEHVMGVPGDMFMEESLKNLPKVEKQRLSKEFVKFNERSTLRLLGDMRAYNYVIVPTYDFDQVQYRIRAMDFDQQSYEGKLKVYRPQFFKDNYPFVKMVQENLGEKSIEQYKKEERSALAKRLKGSHSRIELLMECMKNDHISTRENIENLKLDLVDYTHDKNFKQCANMGEILQVIFDFVVRNYESSNIFIIK
jgi:molybdopterin/thiamine biosynthesis adenylyltransferase